ncbi:hypothetical protein ARALYDRAFT_915958 [Arabidopsis lyrata subsp. lyrata]|uniref:RING-type E3 ubiquitin transferase n=1 Tax=Arabidopsis lyrata subsp. lyrata TaxID=81972 RepID=D7MIK2_ARALL|nr:E3 ubiquitin-protein ligase SINA-like 7 [Arabidopsis lyrata subsp. lyrata]EFH46840.1 hypothetical protein ARALYDRAFT_915958 [Arabidopsis lyrata subsp. lyrata]|eukprot:XP_002870581.1 E3 ubiquitin-protein ligase SINA-like 7 [Arabidopsis lyrata subsp. lyrata]
MEGSSSGVKGSSNINLQKKQRTEDKTRPAMLDFDVLDCPVCFEPLTIPIFQCDNGHLACSSCCPKLSNKCPTCTLHVGNKRCRAMESVLESIFIPCPNANFGCTKSISYGKESTHEKECIFSQCYCPALNCNYTSSYKDLYTHYRTTHMEVDQLNKYICDIPFSVRMNIGSDKNIIIRKEYTKRLLFAVQCFREPCGVYVTVSCIAPSAPEVGQFSYHLSYTVDGHTITYESPEVKRILKVSSQRPQESTLVKLLFITNEGRVIEFGVA